MFKIFKKKAVVPAPEDVQHAASGAGGGLNVVQPQQSAPAPVGIGSSPQQIGGSSAPVGIGGGSAPVGIGSSPQAPQPIGAPSAPVGIGGSVASASGQTSGSGDTEVDFSLSEVEAVIDARIRPGLQADGGNMEVVDIQDGKLLVKLVGACGTCPSAAQTMQFGIERILKEEFPTLKGVVNLSF